MIPAHRKMKQATSLLLAALLVSQAVFAGGIHTGATRKRIRNQRPAPSHHQARAARRKAALPRTAMLPVHAQPLITIPPASFQFPVAGEATGGGFVSEVQTEAASSVTDAALPAAEDQDISDRAAQKLPESPSSKIAADLWQAVAPGLQAGQGRNTVRVIVQTDGDTPVSSLPGRVVQQFPGSGFIVLDVTASDIVSLASRSGVRALSPDRVVTAQGNGSASVDPQLVKTSGLGDALTKNGLGGLDGSGIGIAVLDTGIQADHNAISSGKTAANQMVSVSLVSGDSSTNDVYGHGTHVASIAAGTGRISKQSGRYRGIAPGARLINVRVLGANGTGNVSDVIAGIEWCIAHKNTWNIRVMNLSLGAWTPESFRTDPLCQAAERAVNAGIVVVAAAGNFGKDTKNNKVYGGINSPGIDPMVLTVGAANTKNTVKRSDDEVATYSSRGPTVTDRLMKPDLVAPGNKLVGAQSDQNALLAANPSLAIKEDGNEPRNEMMLLSGSSIAAPVVSGTVALLLQQNPALTPNLIKAVLQYTAQPLAGFNLLEQGAGELNISGALKLTSRVKSTLPTLTGEPLLTKAMPKPYSWVRGSKVRWSQAIYGAYNHIFAGPSLMARYQKIYDAGFRWVGREVTLSGQPLKGGKLLSDGILFADGILVTDGILCADGILVSDGILSADGILVTDGILMADGILVTDGILCADGILVADGILMADSLIFTDAISGSAGSSGGMVNSTSVDGLRARSGKMEDPVSSDTDVDTDSPDDPDDY